MNTAIDRGDTTERQSFGWLSGLTAVVILLGELVGVYLIFGSALGPRSAATVAGTALTGGVMVGSFLLVVVRQFLSHDPGEPKSTAVQAAELTVSVTVLTLVTGLALVGALVLALVTAVGGPEPRTDDGDRLRDRLLEWSNRNSQFLQTNGRGELPLEP